MNTDTAQLKKGGGANNTNITEYVGMKRGDVVETEDA